VRGNLFLDRESWPCDDLERLPQDGDDMIDMFRLDTGITVSDGKEIIDLGNYGLRAEDGVSQMVDHKRKIKGVAISSQLQQDDLDGELATCHEVWQAE
jgi:hypothetical protein